MISFLNCYSCNVGLICDQNLLVHGLNLCSDDQPILCEQVTLTGHQNRMEELIPAPSSNGLYIFCFDCGATFMLYEAVSSEIFFHLEYLNYVFIVQGTLVLF